MNSEAVKDEFHQFGNKEIILLKRPGIKNVHIKVQNSHIKLNWQQLYHDSFELTTVDRMG